MTEKSAEYITDNPGDIPRQRRKVIQVVFVPDEMVGSLLLLCDDGSLWGEDQKSGWVRIEGPPE